MDRQVQDAIGTYRKDIMATSNGEKKSEVISGLGESVSSGSSGRTWAGRLRLNVNNLTPNKHSMHSMLELLAKVTLNGHGDLSSKPNMCMVLSDITHFSDPPSSYTLDIL